MSNLRLAIALSIGVLVASTVGAVTTSAQESPMCAGQQATIIGTPGVDVLIGTSKDDVIVGLSGNDRIDGRGGSDLICGGPGDDVLAGGDGDDSLFGDFIAGGAG